MKATFALKALAEVTSSQWGFVSTAQAEAQGVSKLQLSRLTREGHLFRIRHGVYKDAGAPLDILDDIRAEWISFKPKVLAFDRLRSIEQDVVVVGKTAAWLTGLSEFTELPYEFAAPTRIQSSNSNVQMRLWRPEPGEVRILNGLPATSPTRTVVDLLLGGTDLGSIAQFVAELAPNVLDFVKIESHAQAIARKYGITTRQIRQLLDEMKWSVFSEREIATNQRVLEQTFRSLLDVSEQTSHKVAIRKIARARIELGAQLHKRDQQNV